MKEVKITISKSDTLTDTWIIRLLGDNITLYEKWIRQKEPPEITKAF